MPIDEPLAPGPGDASTPRLVADERCHTGEGVLWHPGVQRLYWVDIPNGRLFAYDPRADHHETAYERDGAIGGFTVQRDGALLLFEEAGRIETWDPATGETRLVRGSIAAEADSRFNDVVADPLGGVFCGTMPQGDSPGRLYRLAPDGELSLVADAVGISNGLGFTPDLTGLYHTETLADRIYRYGFDPETGEVGDRTVFADTTDDAGQPDGLAVDSMGYVWSARWGGGRVVRHAPDGEPVASVAFPARKVSCPTFGGPAYRDGYVTTALDGGTRDEEGESEGEGEGAGAGALFAFDPGVRGVPEFRSAVDAGR